MIWDKLAFCYDLFANVINRRANKKLCRVVENLICLDDDVLECACGTGLLTGYIAKKCKSLIATDFSEQMIFRAQRKYSKCTNVKFQKADIMKLDFADESFNVVVAANVIHLLEKPLEALAELDRVCKIGGKIIIPTYIGKNKNGQQNKVTKAIGKLGVNFKRNFTEDSYRELFKIAGYCDVEYILCSGKIPCSLAMIKKN